MRGEEWFVMKGMKRVITFMIAMAMLVGVLGGCGEEQTAKVDDANAQVTLKWMFVGPGEQKDSQKVWDKFKYKNLKIVFI